MGELRCLKHKDYKGNEAPQLTCKACCAIYIEKLRKTKSSKDFNPAEWVKQRSNEKKQS